MAKKPSTAIAKRTSSNNSHPPSKRPGPAPILMRNGHEPRHCDSCHKRYYQGNMARMWITRNGVRMRVWIYKCTNCFTPPQVARFLLNMQLPPPQFKIQKQIASR